MDGLSLNFDLTRRHLRVHHVGGAAPDETFDGYAVLHLELAGSAGGLAMRIRIDKDLCYSVTVTKVYEGDSTVVPEAVYPAVECHPCVDGACIQSAAGNGSFVGLHVGESTMRAVRSTSCRRCAIISPEASSWGDRR